MQKWITVGSIDDLTPGQYIYVELTTVGLLLINIGGEYFAVENVCSHDGGDLCEGTICGEEITCPRHGARFNLKTGEVLCAPAFEDIDTYPVRVVDNMVQVCNQATK